MALVAGRRKSCSINRAPLPPHASVLSHVHGLADVRPGSFKSFPCDKFVGLVQQEAQTEDLPELCRMCHYDLELTGGWRRPSAGAGQSTRESSSGNVFHCVLRVVHLPGSSSIFLTYMKVFLLPLVGVQDENNRRGARVRRVRPAVSRCPAQETSPEDPHWRATLPVLLLRLQDKPYLESEVPLHEKARDDLGRVRCQGQGVRAEGKLDLSDLSVKIPALYTKS